MHKAAPPPDRGHVPRFESREVVEVLYSDDGLRRVVISLDDQRLFHLDAGTWDTDDWEICGAAFWISVGRTSLTDTLERARTLAAESLA